MKRDYLFADDMTVYLEEIWGSGFKDIICHFRDKENEVQEN